ncbi:hypothetical protein PROFUN_00394 [Planoprotostelium fungivorum]|uniref:Uncharacterized protein n=1 Tax=Planoprotostelium fungivorum TaxID=1890364 RepID=A0A2P6NY91_9EUKA|nr:hypothetical protein PROFUN_00394 [Planoprotostelium fungivorum]
MADTIGRHLLRHIFSFLFRHLYDHPGQNQTALRSYNACQLVSHLWNKVSQAWFDLKNLDYRPFWVTYERCNHPAHRIYLQRLSNIYLPTDIDRLVSARTEEKEQTLFFTYLIRALAAAVCSDLELAKLISPHIEMTSEDLSIFFYHGSHEVDLQWKHLESIGCMDAIVNNVDDEVWDDQILCRVIKMGRLDLFHKRLQKRLLSSRYDNVILLTAIEEGQVEMVDLLCKSVQIDLNVNRDALREAMEARGYNTKVLDAGVIVEWPAGVSAMDEKIGWDIVDKILSMVITDGRALCTCRSVSHRWAERYERWLTSPLFFQTVFWRTYRSCDSRAHCDFLLRLIHQCNGFLPDDVFQTMWKEHGRISVERDRFIQKILEEYLKGNFKAKKNPNHNDCNFLARVIIRIGYRRLLDTDYFRDAAMRIIDSLFCYFKQYWADLADYIAGDMKSYLIREMIQSSPGCEEVIKSQLDSIDFTEEDEGWRKTLVTLSIMSYRPKRKHTLERLLSHSVIPLCLDFYHFILAVNISFTDMITHIGQHLQLTVQLMSNIFTPSQNQRRIDLGDGSSVLLMRNISLMELSELGCINMLRDIIEEGLDTTFNNQILVAVVKSGRTDLLNMMIEKMWFSSGPSNEALLLALLDSQDEMAEILCGCDKINLSINREQLVEVALTNGNDRIIIIDHFGYAQYLKLRRGDQIIEVVRTLAMDFNRRDRRAPGANDNLLRRQYFLVPQCMAMML